MAFKYRFLQLLNLAVHDEDQVKNKLAMKDRQIAEADGQIKKMDFEYQCAMDEKAQDLLSGNMEKVKMYSFYLVRLKKQREFLVDEKKHLLAQREKILVELTEKRRMRKTYEKIRERDERSYLKDEQKKEQKKLDDFASRPKSVTEETDDA